ncbi:hypothetical protein N9D08_00235 [bacterium]|nr:hypothetical protein [bacterium]
MARARVRSSCDARGGARATLRATPGTFARGTTRRRARHTRARTTRGAKRWRRERA